MLRKKLLCLNLAILLLLTLLPVQVVSAGSGVYQIKVGEELFSSNVDHSTTYFNYVATAHTLTLYDGYNGGSIFASGDLKIIVDGDVTVCRDSVTSPTSLIHGIMAEDLEIDVHSGSLTVTGGEKSNGTGGDAIRCDSFVFENPSGTATFTGGEGGQNESPVEPFLGGAGIKANSVTIDGDCTVTGGSAQTGGPGISFTNSCRFGMVYCTVIGGLSQSSDENVEAIQDSNSVGFSLATHTSCDHFAYETATHAYNWKESIHPAKYKIVFDPDGGHKANGSTSPDILTKYYPQAYGLSNYTYYRDGYQQVGWYITSGDLFYPLDAVFTPQENTTVYAQWEPMIGGNILLNGLEYRFTQNEHFHKYNGIVTLPEKLLYRNAHSTPDQLVVWSNTVVPTVWNNTTDNLYMYPGAWYSAGETIRATGSDMYVLYAHEYPKGTTLIYHANGGTVEGGGDMLIEDCTGDLTNHMIADIADYFTRPQYEFLGWYETPVSTPPELQLIHQAGDTMSTTLGTRQDLYAVWKQITHYEYASGNVEMIVSPTELKATVTLDSDWCADNNVQKGFCATYDEYGRMIGIFESTTLAPEKGGGLGIGIDYTEKLIPKCNLFLLNTSGAPVLQNIKIIE